MRSRQLIAIALAIAPVTAAAQTIQANETLLEVAAQGSVDVAPDRASLMAGVVRTGATPQDASAAANEALATLTAALRAAGVAAREMQTQRLNVTPQYAPMGQGVPRITGYTATGMLSVRILDLDRADAIYSAAFNGGSNNVQGPFFSLADDRQAVEDARRDAIAKARAEAESYAGGFGMRVARVIRISERGHSSAYQPVVVRGSAFRPPAPPPPPPPTVTARVETGVLRQTVDLWVDFALVPR